MTPSRAFIIDVDNTLIDTEKIRSDWKNRFKTKFAEAYKKAKHPKGYLDTKKLAELLSVNGDYFYKTNFKKFLFKDSLKCLIQLKKYGKTTIFSLGDKTYQPLKIKESGIEKAVGSKNVFIVQDKTAGINYLIKKLVKEGASEITMVDDVSSNLEKAIKVYPKIINIWIRYGKYKNKYPLIKNIIAYECESFTCAADYLSRLIGIIKPQKSTVKLSVLKGINKKQISQLIAVTKIDRAISKFTHDVERFKNLKTFARWKGRGKIIYTLTDKTGKLIGIIWFSKKTYKNLKYTFAIRIYKPFRGKGLAKKFMKYVFEDFLSNKISGVWLKIDKENKVADNLYKSYGFKNAENTDKKSKVMVYLKNS